LTEQRCVKAELQLMLTRGTAIFLASLTACNQGRNDRCIVLQKKKLKESPDKTMTFLIFNYPSTLASLL
jgi:hypothetical protein